MRDENKKLDLYLAEKAPFFAAFTQFYCRRFHLCLHYQLFTNQKIKKWKRQLKR